MTRPRGLGLLLAAFLLAGCGSAERVFVLAADQARGGEWRMAVSALEVESRASGLRIVGRVTDAETEDLLVGATAAVVGTERGTVVQTDGRFVLDGLEAEQSVLFSYAGYAPYTLTVRALAGLEADSKGARR
ncbi:carboxypeptidase-like regulatory domain-containing protein [Rubrivirga sp.]|uniref:carboxypeptidase-like regulatory domain-containing protein n=1 Tax=Rubrivirga sp. TaxID=1885344 RepID=UPI003C752AAF